MNFTRKQPGNTLESTPIMANDHAPDCQLAKLIEGV